MNKKKIKWIIAREGLILLGILLIGMLIAYLGDFLNQRSEPIRSIIWDNGRIATYQMPLPIQMLERASHLLTPPKFDFQRIGNTLFVFIEDFGLLIFLCGYPLYWLIRFIIWALRTLREK